MGRNLTWLLLFSTALTLSQSSPSPGVGEARGQAGTSPPTSDPTSGLVQRVNALEGRCRTLEALLDEMEKQNAALTKRVQTLETGLAAAQPSIASLNSRIPVVQT